MEQAIFEIILELREEKQKASKNVATSQRHDVWSTRRGSQLVANVATHQRRDVSVISTSPLLKRKGTRNRGGSKNVRTRAHKAKQQRPRSAEKRPTFVFFFFFSDKTVDVL